VAQAMKTILRKIDSYSTLYFTGQQASCGWLKTVCTANE